MRLCKTVSGLVYVVRGRDQFRTFEVMYSNLTFGFDLVAEVLFLPSAVRPLRRRGEDALKDIGKGPLSNTSSAAKYPGVQKTTE